MRMTIGNLKRALATRTHELTLADAQLATEKMSHEALQRGLTRRAEAAEAKLLFMHEIRARDQILASNLHRAWARQGGEGNASFTPTP